MTLSYVLMQNLQRNRLRSALTALAFALPMAVFVAAISYVAALVNISAANEKQLRLGVHQKTTIVNLLPEGIRRKIEELDPQRTRLTAVCGMRWFGGRVPNTQSTLTSLAADADTFPEVYSDVDMTKEDIEAWNKDRQAAIVGPGVAARNNWKVGDRVTLESTVPPYISLEFRIVKVIQVDGRDNFFYFRRDYLSESYKSANMEDPRCNILWVKCKSGDGLRTLQREIDETFANTPDETKSEDENAFAANFIKAAGDIPGLMKVMAIVVVVVIALVAGNTMMMSFRERMRELAVFKAIGFQSGRIFRIVLAESLMLALSGAVLGIVPTVVLLQLPFMKNRLAFGQISSLEPSRWAVAGSLMIALAVGVVAGIWPAYQALRLRTVTALRTVN